MEILFKNEYLHPRVKLCHLLNKFIKQAGVVDDVLNSVLAKECFTILSKQIYIIQIKQRLLGQNSILDIDDNSFYLREHLTYNDFGNDLKEILPYLIYPSFVDGIENFEENIRDRLYSLLSTLINNLLKQGVDN